VSAKAEDERKNVHDKSKTNKKNLLMITSSISGCLFPYKVFEGRQLCKVF
jgi:hypothetical protein